MIALTIILLIVLALLVAGTMKGDPLLAAGLKLYLFATFGAFAIWLGSFFGENGFLYVMLGFSGLMLLLWAWMKSTEAEG